MKELLNKLQNAFAAVAFAEAGEFETAKQIADGDKPKSKPKNPAP